jgi:hypothetical protein
MIKDAKHAMLPNKPAPEINELRYTKYHGKLE